MSFEHNLNQTATRYEKTGYDVEGKPIVSTGESFSVRAEEADRLIKKDNGSEITIDTIFFVLPDQEISIDDKILYNSETYKVIKVEPMITGRGVLHHKEILAKRTKE